MAGFRSIKKPVILEIPTIIIATPTGTDIPFLTKMQKRANPADLKLPFFNNSLQETIITVRLKFHELCQQADIKDNPIFCYKVFC